ncbi:MAG: ATP-dependent helicase [Prosthecobacter sp.]|uniref:UvrD-helicase domain-containing protein n=1 Tax=Prosthecobacter sp. TaxID=1965333 RepID=UPI003BAFD2D6
MFVWTEDQLDPEQDAAVRSDGNVFLIACPGSGKTRTLTYKIAYELSCLTSDKKRIVGITYTHRAADEIHERIDLLGVDASQLWIGTIHSFCLEWILKPYGIYHEKLKNGFRVINSYSSEQLITDLCSQYTNPRIQFRDCEFYYTETGIKYACTNSWRLDSVKQVLSDYLKILSDNGQIDFELMLYYAYQLIQEQPLISMILGKIFSKVLVDEYQDTKSIQYSIIAAIVKASQGESTIFVVGDPNQSIYGSLGGYPIPVADFERMADITINEMELSKNYRSSERVVDYFSEFNVFDTTIESASPHRDYPSKISFIDTVQLDALHEEIVRLVRYNIEVVGIAPHEVCILAPWWVSLASMTRQLVTRLPEYDFDGPGLIPFGRDLDNFWYKMCRLALTTASPAMFIRRKRWANEILVDLAASGFSTDGLTSKMLLRHCNSIKIEEEDGLAYLEAFFHQLCLQLGCNIEMNAMLKEHHAAFFESARSRIERLTSDGAGFIGELSNFRKVFGNRGGITVSTIHGIKGDEYDAVISYALLEGMVPHFTDGQDSAKKLLYVVCSRARKNLHLISERRLDNRGVERQTTISLANHRFDYDVIAEVTESCAA